MRPERSGEVIRRLDNGIARALNDAVHHPTVGRQYLERLKGGQKATMLGFVGWQFDL
jgi:hypothetical protein